MRDRNRGLGAAAYIHVGGGARIYGSDGCGAMVKVDDSGQVTLITGASELGQGSESLALYDELARRGGEMAEAKALIGAEPLDVFVENRRYEDALLRVKDPAAVI